MLCNAVLCEGFLLFVNTGVAVMGVYFLRLSVVVFFLLTATLLDCERVLLGLEHTMEVVEKS